LYVLLLILKVNIRALDWGKIKHTKKSPRLFLAGGFFFTKTYFFVLGGTPYVAFVAVVADVEVVAVVVFANVAWAAVLSFTSGMEDIIEGFFELSLRSSVFLGSGLGCWAETAASAFFFISVTAEDKSSDFAAVFSVEVLEEEELSTAASFLESASEDDEFTLNALA